MDAVNGIFEIRRLAGVEYPPARMPAPPWTLARVVEAFRAHAAAGGRATYPGLQELRRSGLGAAIPRFGGIAEIRRLAGVAAPARLRPRFVAWLRDGRGRPYGARLVGAVGFRVMHQAGEAMLWKPVLSGYAPLKVALQVSRDELVRAVGGHPGAYQLTPVNGRGEQVGDPPQMVIVTRPPT